MDYLQISNLPIMWFLCSFTVIIAAVQAVLFIRAANKATKECRIDPEIPKKAFRIGLVTAIGGPMSWLRLSIIGAAPTELAAATNGATAAGVTLGGEGYTLEILAVSWFAMALNGAGWLLVTGVATPSLEVLRDKLSGGDTHWLGYMSAACSIGIFGYLNINSIVSKGFLNGGPVISMGNLVAVVSGALCMMALGKWVTPKHPKLAEYSLGIAMLFGIACALILT